MKKFNDYLEKAKNLKQYTVVGTSYTTGSKREFVFNGEEEWQEFKKTWSSKYPAWSFDFDNVTIIDKGNNNV